MPLEQARRNTANNRARDNRFLYTYLAKPTTMLAGSAGLIAWSIAFIGAIGIEDREP